MSKKYEIGKDLEDKLYPLENKLNKETSMYVFSKAEQNILLATYEKINGSVLPTNCSGCFKQLKKSVLNWLKMYPKRVVVKTESKKVVKKKKTIKNK